MYQVPRSGGRQCGGVKLVLAAAVLAACSCDGTAPDGQTPPPAEATAIATITGANTGLEVPRGVALDGTGRLYVANATVSQVGRITVYAAGATGNATTITTIEGANTGLSHPVGVALDGAGQLYVANDNSNSITVYAAGATGNATPTATITGANTGLNDPSGVAVDAAGRLYVANFFNADSINVYTITVYAAGATGDASPTATIAGANTGLFQPSAVALDGTGRLYVANATAFGGGRITVYAAGATGNATPITTIAGANTGLSHPLGVALDGAGQLYVANVPVRFGETSITVYAAGATGNATPIATITWFNSPTGSAAKYFSAVALDASGQLYVANSWGNSITVYAAGATGNAPPSATITGATTGLKGPLGIALGP